MRRLPWLFLPLTALLLSLSGCLFGDAEEMMTLPAAPAAYESLQARIAEERGEGESIAPIGGENRQSVQLADLNGDGRQEAVAFFRDERRAENPLRIAVFCPDHREDYRCVARIDGAGNDIQSVELVELTGDGSLELLVNWQASAAVHTAAVYDLSTGQPKELLRESCDGVLSVQLDEDRPAELLIAQRGSGQHPWTVLCWNQDNGTLVPAGKTTLSRGAEELLRWEPGTLADGSPAVFVTSRFGEYVRVIDVLSMTGDSLRNRAADRDAGQSKVLCPDWAIAVPTDLTGDGVTEVPVSLPVTGYGESRDRVFQWLSWRQYASDGSFAVVRKTCCPPSGAWYLDLPDSWPEDISQSFVSLKPGQEVLSLVRAGETKPFLTISCLTGENRVEQAAEDGQILLYDGGSVLYTARLFPSVWDCGLDRERIVAGFHVAEVRD